MPENEKLFSERQSQKYLTIPPPIVLDCKGPTSNGLNSYELCTSTAKNTSNPLSLAQVSSASS